MSNSTSASLSNSTWLRIARIAWVILALVYFGLFIAAIPFGYEFNLSVCESELCSTYQLFAAEVEQLEKFGISLQLYAGIFAAIELTLLSWAALGVFVFLRRRDWMGLIVSMALISIGINGLSDSFNILSKQTPQFTLIYTALSAVSIALLLLLLFLFPDGNFVPRWTRAVAFVLIVVALADPLLAMVVPMMENAPGTVVSLGVLLSGIVLGFIAQIQRYRDYSNLEQRQQTKWVIFGFLAFMLVAITWSSFVELFPPAPGSGRLIFNIIGFPILLPLMLALPITMTLSILRYRLFDIDVIIKRTAVYGALTIAILVIYFVAVVVLQSAFRALTGQGDQLAIVASTLLIAALFNPMRRRIQTAVNRRFFRGDYDAAQTLNSFGESIQDEVDLEHMQAALLSTVEETMQPTRVSLWLRED